MKIQFLKNHMQYADGEIAEIPDDTAKYLVRCSCADYFDEDVEIKEDYLINIIEANKGTIDLLDTTFVIPVYYDHYHRKQNLLLTLAFLRNNFKTNIIIGEYAGYNFEFLSKYVRYEYLELPYFHRTKMINDLVRLSQTPIIVNWDCDNICDAAQLLESVEAIRNGADISYPFDGNVIRVPRYMFADAFSLNVHDIKHKDCQNKGFNSVGHAVVMNKNSFITAGMENENFISWGPEDGERYNRYKILGLNIHRASGAMYHMDHYIGTNSSGNHEWFRHNNEEYEKVVRMSREQLQDYVRGWEWVNRPNGNNMAVS